MNLIAPLCRWSWKFDICQVKFEVVKAFTYVQYILNVKCHIRLKSQVRTTSIAAAFSFSLNARLNVNDSRCRKAPVPLACFLLYFFGWMCVCRLFQIWTISNQVYTADMAAPLYHEAQPKSNRRGALNTHRSGRNFGVTPNRLLAKKSSWEVSDHGQCLEMADAKCLVFPPCDSDFYVCGPIFFCFT